MHFQVTKENFDKLETLCDACDNNIMVLVAKWGREVCRNEKKHNRKECSECPIENWMEELNFLHEEQMKKQAKNRIEISKEDWIHELHLFAEAKSANKKYRKFNLKR